MRVIQLSIEQIKIDLKSGFTRTNKDKNFDPAIGSIEDKYGLTNTEVLEVFSHPELKGLRTVVPKSRIIFVEELPQTSQVVTTEEQNDTQEQILDLEEVANDVQEVTQESIENSIPTPVSQAWANSGGYTSSIDGTTTTVTEGREEDSNEASW